MSNRPEATQPPDDPNQPGEGWITPPNAVTGQTAPAPAAEVPLPTDAEPERPGGWFVPPEATERASALMLASLKGTTPPVAPAADKAQGEKAQTPVSEGAAPSDQVDYSNYVPGVGFVSQEKAEELRKAAEMATPGTEPVSAADTGGTESQTEPASEPVPGSTAASGGPPKSADKPAAPEPHHAPDVVAQAPGTAAQPAAESQPATASSTEAQPAAEADLSKRFSDVERAVQVLRRRYTAGGLTRDQLKEELRRLMILDTDGLWWMIGLETDRWYKYNGSEWVLATPPGRPPQAEATPSTPPSAGTPVTVGGDVSQKRFDIPLDEHGMPLPQRVPVEDEGATMVGKWATRLGSEGVAPYDGGVTVPSHAVDSGATVPTRATPGWQARLAQSSTATPAAGTPGSAITQRVGEAAVPSPKLSIQPDYGLKPSGLLSDRQRYGGCLIRLAIVGVFLFLGTSVLGVGASVFGYTGIIAQYESAIGNLGASVDASSQSVRIYDSAGRQLSQLNDPKLGASLHVKIGDISPYMIFAMVATENERFYSDPGFDIVAMVRAVLQNLRAGGVASGASTITQQLARARVLDPGAADDRSAGRKITEVIVSSEIARRYTKTQILEFYLNTANFGNLAYGIEAAAQTYFKKSAKDLNLAEASFLAGFVQAPAAYDPAIRPPQGQESPAILRARTVRGLMVKLGCIQMEHAPYNTGPFCVTQGDVDKARLQIAVAEASMATFTPTATQATYPHFVNYVKQQLEDQFGPDALYTSGFSVYTTIDPRIQDTAEQAVKNQITALASLRVTNGAVMAIRPTDGAILAMVGSVEYNSPNAGQVNHVLAPRQPGSSIKPFVYLAALERNAQNQYWTPATVIWDVPSCFGAQGNYCPRNYDSKFHGPQTMRYTLANSYNIPAVKTLDYVTIDRFKAMADRVGITFPLTQPEQAGLTLTLGGAEVRLIDMVRAYGVLANNGQRVDLYAISKITRKKDGKDEVVFQAPAPQPRQEVEPGLAFLITSILSDNAARTPAMGANSSLVLRNGHLAAVKTGTTNDNRDNWTIGYTPNLVVGVWVGNSDGTPMSSQATGLTGAAPIWNAVMTGALTGTPPVDFKAPPTVASMTICADFGTQDFAGCKNRRTELYFTANPPPAPDAVFRSLPIDSFSGLVANENCPDYVVNQTFLTTVDSTAVNWLNTTPEGKDWATQHGLQLPISQPPTDACPPGMPRPVFHLTSPQPNTEVHGLVQIVGAISLPNFNRYQIEVGVGQQPTTSSIVYGPIVSQPGVNDTILGLWDTGSVPDGVYTIKLWAVDGQGHFLQVLVPVVVRNTGVNTGGGTGGTFPGVPPTATPPGFPGPGISVPPTETPIVVNPGVPPTQQPISIFPPTVSPGG